MDYFLGKVMDEKISAVFSVTTNIQISLKTKNS
jgi:hypothetical protein